MSDGMRSGYTREMVDQMASLVKEYSLLQPVTFPVNGSLLKLSIGEMQRLLFQVNVAAEHSATRLMNSE